MDDFTMMRPVAKAGSAFTSVISPAPRLRIITAWVDIMESPIGTLELSLYRMSGTMPGLWSRDIYTMDYRLDGGVRPVHVGEFPKKYRVPPGPTGDQSEQFIGGHQLHVWGDLSPDNRRVIEAMIRTAPAVR